MATTQIANGRLLLQLHQLQDGPGTPLLCLHALGGSAADFAKSMPTWPGPIHALDFSGHGYSGRLFGGVYMPEALASDADAALAELGTAVLLGFGLGAYVALLLAGGRPDAVPAAVLCGGPGLGGVAGDANDLEPWDLPTAEPTRHRQSEPSTDPIAQLTLTDDMRPPNYATDFACSARSLILREGGWPQPAWWRAVAELQSVRRTDEALGKVLLDVIKNDR